MSKTFKDAPEDIREAAQGIALGFGFDEAVLIGAIAAALDTEREKSNDLVAKAKNLVDLLDDAEVNHGGLVGTITLRAKNELRLELAKWK